MGTVSCRRHNRDGAALPHGDPVLKVHISLEPEIARDPARRAALRARIEAITPLIDVHERRFERHGLLTASIAGMAPIAAIEALPGVVAVEPDEERRAL